MKRPHVQLVTDDAVEVILQEPLRVELTPAGPPAFTRGGEPVPPTYADLVGLVEALARELIGDVFEPVRCGNCQMRDDTPHTVADVQLCEDGLLRCFYCREKLRPG